MPSPLKLADMHPLEYLAVTRYSIPKDQIMVLFDRPYPADPVLEPDYVGMTYRQVALAKQVRKAADGNLESLNMLLDRMVGRAAQVNTNLNVQATYQDYLDSIDPPQDAEVIDVTVRDPDREAEEIT